MVNPIFISILLQNPIDFFKFGELGNNAVVFAILFIIYTALRIFGEWLKKRKDRNADFMQTISEAMVTIKEQVVYMNRSLDEMKTATIMVSGITENMAQNISKIDDVCNGINTSVKILMDRESR